MSQATAYLDSTLDTSDMQRVRRRAILSCAVGNFVELFDFVIFGLFAAQIGANFFPNTDPIASLLSSFATYGVGFVMRPVGAIVIGALGDRKGRKTALVLTVGLMAAATALTGLIPSYASIGILAPILLVLCRLVQGFSTGGEWGGAATFLVEFAPPGKRGFIGSMQQFSVGLGLIMGTLCAAILNSELDKEQMIAWGWRIPFILGFLLAPIGLYLRSRVAESPAFDRTIARRAVASAPVRDTLTFYLRPVLAAFGLSVVGTVGNYTYNIFLPSFASTARHPGRHRLLLDGARGGGADGAHPGHGLALRQGRAQARAAHLGARLCCHRLPALHAGHRNEERDGSHAHGEHRRRAARHVCGPALRHIKRALPDQGALHGALDRL